MTAVASKAPAIAPPFVGAIVVVRGPRSLAWKAAIVTRLTEETTHRGGGWMPKIDAGVFEPGGGILPVRFVDRIGAADDPDAERDHYVWRWPNEAAAG